MTGLVLKLEGTIRVTSEECATREGWSCEVLIASCQSGRTSLARTGKEIGSKLGLAVQCQRKWKTCVPSPTSWLKEPAKKDGKTCEQQQCRRVLTPPRKKVREERGLMPKGIRKTARLFGHDKEGAEGFLRDLNHGMGSHVNGQNGASASKYTFLWTQCRTDG